MQYRLAKIVNSGYDNHEYSYFSNSSNVFDYYIEQDHDLFVWESLEKLLEFSKSHIQKENTTYYILDIITGKYSWKSFEFTELSLLEKFLQPLGTPNRGQIYFTPGGYIHEDDIYELDRMICPICEYAVIEDEYVCDSEGKEMCLYCLETGEGTDEVESEEIYNDEGDEE